MDENHLLDVVDENDQVIGKDYKENKFSKGFISRNAVVMVKDKDGRFIVVKRSPKKRTHPNKFDSSVCGNVNVGETDLEAAKREMEEELNIRCEVKFLKKKFNHFQDMNLKYFTGIFLAHYDGEITTNDEIKEYHRLSLEEIEKKLAEDPDSFTEGFRVEFYEIKHLLE